MEGTACARNYRPHQPRRNTRHVFRAVTIYSISVHVIAAARPDEVPPKNVEAVELIPRYLEKNSSLLSFDNPVARPGGNFFIGPIKKVMITFTIARY